MNTHKGTRLELKHNARTVLLNACFQSWKIIIFNFHCIADVKQHGCHYFDEKLSENDEIFQVTRIINCVWIIMISELRQTRTKISRSRLIQWKQNLEWRLNSFATVANSSQLDRLSTPLNSIYSTNSTIISTILILLSESIKNSVQSLKITKISSYVKICDWMSLNL